MTLPNVFSINGFCGVWWGGPQADVGRYLSANPVDHGIAVANWRPVGYASQSFPLSTGVDAGLAELKRLRALYPGPYLISSWSEGAIIAARYVKEELAHGITDYRGGVSFGDPVRAAGQWAPHAGGAAYGYTTQDPGGAGIAGTGNPADNWVAPDNYHRYAHPGDLYTVCPQTDEGRDMNLIYHFALTEWGGAITDLWAFANQMLTNPSQSVWAVMEAVLDAITFYGGNTKQHQNYDPRPAQNYLAGLARAIKLTL